MPIFTLPYYKNLQKKSMSNSCHWMHTMYVQVVHFLTLETAHFENMWENLESELRGLYTAQLTSSD